ncbi:type I methionyl aminopeptidase [candidate division WOR-3 bacterium]|nr:type I methionyl aminopeptidase [candidate division WOR-3 bacterium]
MRDSGRILARVLKLVAREIAPGKTLAELDRACEELIRSEGGEPTFKGYRGFPCATCISINEEVVHGIPGERRLEPGDLVKVDCGVTRNGLITDAARTYEVGDVGPQKHALALATEEAFRVGIEQARAGNRVSDIGAAVEEFVEERGYSVVRDLCGHGVGRELHEEPSVPNYGRPGKGIRLEAGMTLAIEPMVNLGRFEVETEANGWTVVTKDRLPSAHYENTILVTDGAPEILTLKE